jgi:hypothetical protein
MLGLVVLLLNWINRDDSLESEETDETLKSLNSDE